MNEMSVTETLFMLNIIAMGIGAVETLFLLFLAFRVDWLFGHKERIKAHRLAVINSATKDTLLEITGKIYYTDYVENNVLKIFVDAENEHSELEKYMNKQEDGNFKKYITINKNKFGGFEITVKLDDIGNISYIAECKCKPFHRCSALSDAWTEFI